MNLPQLHEPVKSNDKNEAVSQLLRHQVDPFQKR